MLFYEFLYESVRDKWDFRRKQRYTLFTIWIYMTTRFLIESPNNIKTYSFLWHSLRELYQYLTSIQIQF